MSVALLLANKTMYSWLTETNLASKIAEERLPPDAQFKGYEEVIVQDIDLRTENIQFRKEKYYSPSPIRAKGSAC